MSGASVGGGRREGGSGCVYLVGAGPGDPGLLTVRAVELLRAAEVLAHDELVAPEILALAPPGAERLRVGRRHGQGSLAYRLHPEVLARARAGRRVVRLKAGDPFVFGRGGEEAEELADADIPFEIVPGITAALGAAAFAGIPLTHRHLASDVTFATGHGVNDAHLTHTEWRALAAGRGTIVLYMAVRTLGATLARLVDGGRPPSTPAAYVAGATSPGQVVVTGTLADLAERVAGRDPAVPAVVIVGEVVRLRSRIAWFEREGARVVHAPRRVPAPAALEAPASLTFSPGTAAPAPRGTPPPAPAAAAREPSGPRSLPGRRVLVARVRPGPSELAAALRAHGAHVVEAPQVEVEELELPPAFLDTLGRLHAFHAIVFACAAGVEAFARRARLPASPAAIAVGTAAAAALRRRGVAPLVLLPGACDKVLHAHASVLCAGPLLLVTSLEGRPGLAASLAALGACVEPLPLYRTVRRMSPLPAGLDLVVLPSSTAARAVLASDAGPALLHLPMVAMGPRTEEAARRHGARHVVRAPSDGVPALVSCVLSLEKDLPC